MEEKLNKGQQHNLNKQYNRKSRKYLFLWILALLLINVLAFSYYFQLDLTHDKRYSINKKTKSVLKQLNHQVNVSIYLTGNELPAGFKRLANSTEEMVRRFRDISKNKISFQLINPLDMDTAQINELARNRIFGFPVTISDGKRGNKQVMVFPFALVEQGNKKIAVLLQESSSPMMNMATINNSEILLEYNLANAIHKVDKPSLDSVLYITGNGQPESYMVFDLANSINQQYTFHVENLQSIPQIDNSYKALIINQPKLPFTELDKVKIDQYLMKGGNILLTLDGANISMDSFQQSSKALAVPNNVELTDFLFNLGVRVNNNLVQDADKCVDIPLLASANQNKTPDMFPWVYYPIVGPASNQAIVKNLNEILLKFPSSIDLVNENAAIQKTVLLQTSKYSKLTASPALIDLLTALELPDRLTFKRTNVPVSVLIEGQFNSMFYDRLKAGQGDSLLQNYPNLIKQSTEKSSVVLVSDGDVFNNEVQEESGPMEMGMYKYSQYKFNNKSFLMNSLEYLTDSFNLLEARSKNYQASLLDRKRVDKETTKWQLINIGLPVVLTILFGLIFTFLRKKRYS